jgi:DNA-binding transcriptional ArsR family regulator
MHRHAMNESDLQEAHTRSVLACLGAASRFRLVRALAAADRCVGELAEAVGLSQSCTTRHLQALERVGLVQGCREGRRVRFRLRAEAPGLSELLGWALSGPGLEALAAGKAHPANRTAPEVAGLPARPVTAKVALRSRTTDAMPPQDKVAQDSMAESESSGPAGPLELENRDLPTVASPLPAWRRNDLEDYLL